MVFGGKFNLLPYNRGMQLISLPIRVSCTETVGAVIRFGADVNGGSVAFTAQTRGEAKGATGLPVAAMLLEEGQGSAAGILGLIIAHSLREAAGCLAAGACDIAGPVTFVERIGTAVILAADLSSGSAFLGKSTGTAAGALDIAAPTTLSELVGCIVSGAIVEELAIYIQAGIPPGGELHIDSDNFEILLAGHSVLHLQSGDWIIADRDLRSILVDSGTAGSLQGSMIYNERYL